MTPACRCPRRPPPAGPSVVDRAIERVGSVISATFVQWELASRRGLLQAMDGRVKLVCLLFLLVVATVKNADRPRPLPFRRAFSARMPLPAEPGAVLQAHMVLAFLFGFLVVLPASLQRGHGRRGHPSLFRLRPARTFWLYTIPQTVGITREGLSVVGLVTLRMVNCLSVCFLLLHTTPFPGIMRSLRVFRVPDMLCVIFVLTYKYIFIFSKMVEALYLARKSRSAGGPAGAGAGAWAAGRVAFLFRKTQGRCEEVFQAMLSRGLEGTSRWRAPLSPADSTSRAAYRSFLSGRSLLWM